MEQYRRNLILAVLLIPSTIYLSLFYGEFMVIKVMAAIILFSCLYLIGNSTYNLISLCSSGDTKKKSCNSKRYREITHNRLWPLLIFGFFSASVVFIYGYRIGELKLKHTYFTLIPISLITLFLICSFIYFRFIKTKK